MDLIALVLVILGILGVAGVLAIKMTVAIIMLVIGAVLLFYGFGPGRRYGAFRRW